MSPKHKVATILFGSVMALRPAVAQENATHRNETDFEAALPSAKFIPNLAEESLDSAAYEEYVLFHRLSGLSRALRDFATAYKGGQMDLKKVKALRKAIQELEKSAWFKPQKAK